MSGYPIDANRDALYNVLIYQDDYYQAANGATFGDIATGLVENWDNGIHDKIVRNYINYYRGEHPNSKLSEEALLAKAEHEAEYKKAQFEMLKAASDRDPILRDAVIGGQYVQGEQTTDAGFAELNHQYDMHSSKDIGLHAYYFTETDEQGNVSYHVVYRGTNGGEWIDNGDAMSGVKRETAKYDPYSSVQQELALEYLNTVARENGWTEEDFIVASGHSKGGNNAQYTTMYSPLIDSCYSFDGQGQSPEEIEQMMKTLGEEEFERRRQHMYFFAAENDYVNVLGQRLIPKDSGHVFFFQTNPAHLDGNIANYHQAHAFLNSDGSFREVAESQGPFALFLEKATGEIMMLDPANRDDATRAIMYLLQKYVAQEEPLYGAQVSPFDRISGYTIVATIVLKELLFTKEGHDCVVFLQEFYRDTLISSSHDWMEEHFPGYKQFFDKMEQIFEERNIDSGQALLDYIKQDPLENTADLLLSTLNDWDTLKAVCEMSAVVAVLAVAAVTLLPLLGIAVSMIVALAVTYTAFKMAIDYISAHWDEFVAEIEMQLEAVRALAQSIFESIKANIEAEVNAVIEKVNQVQKKMDDFWNQGKNAVRVTAEHIHQSINNAYNFISSLSWALARTISGGDQQPVTIDMPQLQSAVDKMLILANQVQAIDGRLDRLYSQICRDMIEESEGVFISLANLYHLSRADINVDEGNRIRRMANNLSSLYEGYERTERWVLSQI